MDNKAVLKRFVGNRDEHVFLDLKRKILYIDNSIVQEIIYENWTGSKLIEYFTCITQGNLNNVKKIKKINASMFEMIVINRINKLFKMAKQYYRLRQDPKKAILSHYMKKIVTNFIRLCSQEGLIVAKFNLG